MAPVQEAGSRRVLPGTTAPTTLNLQAATGTLAAGTYTATVQVNSSLSGVSPASTVVTFNVSGSPVAAQHQSFSQQCGLFRHMQGLPTQLRSL